MMDDNNNYYYNDLDWKPSEYHYVERAVSINSPVLAFIQNRRNYAK